MFWCVSVMFGRVKVNGMLVSLNSVNIETIVLDWWFLLNCYSLMTEVDVVSHRLTISVSFSYKLKPVEGMVLNKKSI